MKVACPFSGAAAYHDGKPYEACDAFNAALLAELRLDRPDLLITSQFANSGRLANHVSPNEDDMVEGLVTRWSEVRSWGTKIVVLVDNPVPNGIERPVDDCILENAADVSKCAFDRARGVSASGAPAQRAAAARVPETQLLDLTEYICPRDTCAPVIGDVLVYRQGSHITATYARTLLPMFVRKLEAALAN